MQEVEKYFDISELQEFSIECNPYPYSETLASVKHIIETYSHLPRIRFSFGIQSLDDSILQQSNRDCTFMGLQQFTQDILAIKESNVVYNFDFIAFGDSSF
jgi:coproporphyrinogen III oxidase-like Fe-S oxidoreductase